MNFEIKAHFFGCLNVSQVSFGLLTYRFSFWNLIFCLKLEKIKNLVLPLNIPFSSLSQFKPVLRLMRPAESFVAHYRLKNQAAACYCYRRTFRLWVCSLGHDHDQCQIENLIFSFLITCFSYQDDLSGRLENGVTWLVHVTWPRTRSISRK